jgi:sulfhydrogenase subunit beta (sulfur reductase)
VKTKEQSSLPDVTIERKNFDTLISTLNNQGYEVIGPTVREGAIVYDFVTSSTDLPVGCTHEQSAGKYRLVNCNDHALFGFNTSPQSWKKFLHPATLLLNKSQRDRSNYTITPLKVDQQKYAFIGVRPCDLAAISVLDKVFITESNTDSGYQTRRSNIFIVVINCGQSGGNCFCASMQTGPRATTGFDLALTEILEKDRHYFVAEAGTEQGEAILKNIPHKEANIYELKSAENMIDDATSQMGRSVDTENISELLSNNSEHKQWQEVGKRCLTCGNCTMVCPTCFCNTIEDVTDLSGNDATRIRKWDSCFTLDFSYIHGGSIRSSAMSRYRQWLTHKFASWHHQFGTSGCVGCGRCITWCPVGIDITEELHAIRTNEQTNPSIKSTKEKS